MKTTFQYDHYYDWQEMSECLKALQAEYPSIIKLESICTSEEGKEVWAVTLSDESKQSASEKPAYYIDGNHHAGEVTGSMAAMHTIDTLCSNQDDEMIADLLQKYTFYVIPKISPDGSDTYLHTPYRLRSVNRPYPFKELADGLHPCDMDGDGVIRMMRVKNQNGAWKCSEDPLVMVKRQPFDTVGDFYDIYPEGEIHNYDGKHIILAPEKWGLDFNRNYPFGWFSEARQSGAGKYPLSNPENKAVADFVLSHKNIGFVATLHTTGGVLVYPPGTYSQAKANPLDMKLYKEVGKHAKTIMGYDTVNVFDGFLIDTVNYSSGAFDDWCYETQGIPAYTIELWNLMERCKADTSWPRKEADDDVKEQEYRLMLGWIKENLGEEEIKPWSEFNHPQLGKVEIGGFDYKFIHQNPPRKFLLQEVEKTTKFMIQNAYALPLLQLKNPKVEKIAQDLYQITVDVVNQGYMPTYLCETSLQQKINQPIKVSLSGAEVIDGSAVKMIEKLGGILNIQSGYAYSGITTQGSAHQDEQLSWLVKAKQKTVINLQAVSEKAGSTKIEISL